ncbi:hypothetical protein [Vulcanisaeta thermophila]|uniref:hypothetical protein n=1 Tax=Vulcanisaeta thermophila TaxID=867917 RepID=UPI000853570E|nr:hypothetical protein [Vulcanisaeta thermophila]
MSTTTITKEEWEELVREVRELRETLNELITTLKPVLLIVEKLPDLLTDPGLFKAASPLLAMPYVMERVNVNTMGAAMTGGFECTSKALEKLQSMDNPPEFSISKLLFDSETKRAMGMMIELLKMVMPCLHEQLKAYRPQ